MFGLKHISVAKGARPKGVVLFVWMSVGWCEEGYGLQDEGGEVGGVAEDHFPDGAGGVGYEYYRE